MYEFMLEMEENINGGPPFHDWEALVVEEFESKPILETQLIHDDHDHDDDAEFGFGLLMNNVVFSDNENVTLMDDDSKKSSSLSSSPEDDQQVVVEYKGSIAERRAAKFGFDASRINVAKFKAVVVSPPDSPPVRSPYVTIPPGISPAALLDSPVMLPNSQEQPSPTTGTLQFQQSNHHDAFLVLNSNTSPAVDREENVIHISALFTPSPPPALSTLSAANKMPTTTAKSPTESTKEDSLKSSVADSSTDAKISGEMAHNSTHINLQKNSATAAMKVQLPQLRDIKGETGIHGSMPEEHKGAYSPAAAAADLSRNAEDGYSWRKYGQKHVKGSEYPRSYYKCNNSSCPVKKKVERSHDGEITEIIYKGAHNHPKPHPRITLGGAPGTTSGEMMDTSEGNEACLKVENGTSWKFNNQLRSKDLKVGSDCKPDGLERTSSTSVLTDILDPLVGGTQAAKSASVLGSGDTPELTSRMASQDGEDEDGTTQGSTSQGDEVDVDESEPKRRKKEMFSTEAYLPSRCNREPRVIVQIESEIDVLDDGYRWRKYGQKVVKGNPNPRSYYKCTSAGCPVRKHVERASDDIKSVLTTYEGKHNHEVPTTKTSGGLPGSFNSAPDASNPNPSALAVSRNPNIPTREMKVQDLPLHYEMKPALRNDFLRSNLLSDFVSDIQIGPSSIYPMKFPSTPLPTSLPYGSFMMNSNGGADSHTSCQKFPPVMLDFPMSIPLNVARSSPTMALSNNFHPYNHNHAMQNGTAIQSSIGNQQIKDSDLRFLTPKEEKRDDAMSDTCAATPDNSNATSSTPFCRVMGNFPS